jgi:hypothetical protein
MADQEQEKEQREEQEAIDRLVRAKKANRALLLSKPNVIGLDVGKRTRAGEATEERVVKVYVRDKVGKSELAEQDLIPPSIKVDDHEVGIDVEEEPIQQPSAFTLRSRPLRGGSSIGLGTAPQISGGTLGICVTLNDGLTYLLSNNHVLVEPNQAGFFWPPVTQPAVSDGGHPVNDVVATLDRFVPLDFGFVTFTIQTLTGPATVTIRNRNFVDAALARVTANPFNTADREIHWIGSPGFLQRPYGPWIPQVRNWLVGRRVCKMGRTTEFTIGKIISVWYDTTVGPYAGGNFAYFEDQIRIEEENGVFAQKGDSGSLVVDYETKAPVGLHMSANPTGTLATSNPLDFVMLKLGIPQI